MDRIPLTRPVFTDQALANLQRVLASGFVAQGPESARFEAEAARMLGEGSMAVAVSSGSAALYVALRSAGVGRGDEVLVPAFSHPAPAYAVVLAGGIPVPVDADPDTLSLDLDQAWASLTSTTKAVVIVDGLGARAPVSRLREVLGHRKITIIEDAACGMGIPGVGRFADMATFSLHPRKVITSGEGGLLVTRDPVLAEKARGVRNFGLQHKGFGPVFDGFGFNFRFNDILAAVARSQLSGLSHFREARRKVVKEYLGLLEHVDAVTVPAGLSDHGQAFQTMAVKTPVPGPELVGRMADRGIEVSAAAHDLTEQPFFTGLWDKLGMHFDCPRARDLASHLVALPLWASMSTDQVRRVVSTLQEVVDEFGRGSD